MPADGPTVEGSGGTKRLGDAAPQDERPSPKQARLSPEPSAAATTGGGGGGRGAFESGAKAGGEASATEHAGEDTSTSGSSHTPTTPNANDAAISRRRSSSTSTVDRPTSPLVEAEGGMEQQGGVEQQQQQPQEEGLGASEAEAEESEVEEASDEEEDEEEPIPPQPSQPQPQPQQPQQQRERGAASNGVEHWLMMQRLRGTDPSALAHSLLQQMGLALSVPLHAMSQEALWALVRRLLTRQDEALAPRRKLPHVNHLDDVVALIRRSRRVMVLTGAGISVACGIPDFRSENGIYARLGEYGLPDPQCMFDIDFFRGNPVPFFRFARELLPGNFRPSVSHLFIRQLERKGKLLRCYTQNIDSLELVAGMDPDRLLQCHGAFETATCLHCRAKYSLEDIRAEIEAQQVPMCRRCGVSPEGVVKPDIVFFGEGLGDRFSKAIERDRPRADLLLVMGSSLKVGPVNKIMQWLPARVPQVLVNRELVGGPNAQFDVELLGDCDAVVLEICRRLGWQLPVEEAANGGVVPGAVREADGSEPFEFAAPNRYFFVNARRPGEEGEGEGAMSSDDDDEEEDESEGEEEEGGEGAGDDARRVGGALKPLAGAAGHGEEEEQEAAAMAAAAVPPSGAGAAAVSRTASAASAAGEGEEGEEGLEEAKETVEGALAASASSSLSSRLARPASSGSLLLGGGGSHPHHPHQPHPSFHVHLFSPLLPPQSPAIPPGGAEGYASAYLPPLGSPLLQAQAGAGGDKGYYSSAYSSAAALGGGVGVGGKPYASSQGNHTPRGSPRGTPLVGGFEGATGEENYGHGGEGGIDGGDVMDELTL